MATEYKDTLNLPRTAFDESRSRRAGTGAFGKMAGQRLYEKIQAARRRPRFILHDGRRSPTATSTSATR